MALGQSEGLKSVSANFLACPLDHPLLSSRGWCMFVQGTETATTHATAVKLTLGSVVPVVPGFVENSNTTMKKHHWRRQTFGTGSPS